ncbi:MarR family winged helix-turn-helix transcriptional regulator [Granulicella arctica]|uniref:MarR family winged helix-turn-helix transcriptional regulator n=1 Tax=Granulicella arctica TaxID=940613 RepID=UPI0021E07995|nr:MarR family winged helix-turn-helix transcriptional regulator [Granulicella arctica]
MKRSADLSPQEWEQWHRWTLMQRLLTQQIERHLQLSFGISKAEFSILVTLLRSSVKEPRVGDLSQSLGWEKSRVSHLLTRMEGRGLVKRVETGAAGRRTGLRLTFQGRQLAERAVTGHAQNIKRNFFEVSTPDQNVTIRSWIEQMIVALQGPEAVSQGSVEP